MQTVIEHYKEIISGLSKRNMKLTIDGKLRIDPNTGLRKSPINGFLADYKGYNDFEELVKDIAMNAEDKVRLLFHEVQMLSELTEESFQVVLKNSLVSIMEHQQELENELEELKTQLEKFDASKTKKIAADRFAIEMFPKVLEAQKNGIKAEAKLCDYFNEKGILSSTGKKFAPSAVHRLLKRQKALGLFNQENETPTLES